MEKRQRIYTKKKNRNGDDGTKSVSCREETKENDQRVDIRGLSKKDDVPFWLSDSGVIMSSLSLINCVSIGVPSRPHY